MNVQFTDYFVDPYTKEPLILNITKQSGNDVIEGILYSADKSAEYNIVNGIPRFIQNKKSNYARSFGYQWKKWPYIQFESANIGKPMEGHTCQMWERILGTIERNQNIESCLIVDIGCGSGRFIDVARKKGARVIGIDYSEAVEVARQYFRDDPNVCICEGDALNLPICSESVDGAFTIGVLHHTPNPENGVKEAFRIIKKRGFFSISVYGKNGYYDYPSVRIWRNIFKCLWPLFRHYPPLFYAYISNIFLRPIALIAPMPSKFIRLFVPFVVLPDLNWSILDTFDSVTPTYQSAHESYEVFKWLKSAGFVNIEPSNWGFTAFHATKHYNSM